MSICTQKYAGQKKPGEVGKARTKYICGSSCEDRRKGPEDGGEKGPYHRLLLIHSFQQHPSFFGAQIEELLSLLGSQTAK